VAEALGDLFGVYTLRDQKRRVRVSEIVKADLWQFGLCQDLLEVVRHV